MAKPARRLGIGIKFIHMTNGYAEERFSELVTAHPRQSNVIDVGGGNVQLPQIVLQLVFREVIFPDSFTPGPVFVQGNDFGGADAKIDT